jgi:carbamoyltransferase
MQSVIDTLFDTLICERFDNVAGGLQRYLEEIVIRWISVIANKLDVSNIALAGGVFANVKLNQKIRQLPCVKTLAITPSPGDESGAIGASIIGNACAGSLPRKRTNNIYLGQASSESSIVDALKLASDNSLIIKPIESEAEEVSRLLDLGEVVGRAVGPMEFGQRALGNRSILANPSRPGVPEKINHYIKNRDFWMPFAPTIIHPYHEKLIYDDDKYTSAFMMIGQDVRASAIDSIRNAAHPRDFTARPQILRRADNVDYYDIIFAFFEKTGIPAVLNTSFNLHGEPIVANAVDAVDVFLRSSLKHLVIDGYSVEKPQAQPL